MFSSLNFETVLLKKKSYDIGCTRVCCFARRMAPWDFGIRSEPMIEKDNVFHYYVLHEAIVLFSEKLWTGYGGDSEEPLGYAAGNSEHVKYLACTVGRNDSDSPR